MQFLRLRSRIVLLSLLAALGLATQATPALAALDAGVAPPVAVDDEKTVRTASEVSIDVTTNDTDADEDFLTITAPGETPMATDHGTVSCFAFGSCSYKSNPGFLGTDGFNYAISDGNGGSDVGHVTITVVANTPPTAVDDAFSAVTSHPLFMDVTANDIDPDQEQGDFLELTAPEPDVELDTAHGKVTCSATGSCQYVSDGGYTGVDGFDYTIIDDTDASSLGHVTITVIANEPPVATDDFYARSDERDLDVLANDTDAEEADLEITAVTQPTNGVVTIADGGGSVHYTATSNFSASDSFTYTITDLAGATDTATVTLDPCPAVGPAIDSGGIVVGEHWVACAALVANGVVGPTTTVFPPQGGSSALLTSGDVALAPGPNDQSGATASHNSNLRGGIDVSVLRLDLMIPAGANCLSFDFAFQSEEYPEFVGQSYNDAFLAELDASTWLVENSVITAPNNFAFDSAGGIVSVNGSFFEPGRVVTNTGSQYDGSTPLLNVRRPITPGPHALYLTIFDAGDSALDSAAFVDGLVAGPAGPGGCSAGANEPPNAVDNSYEVNEDEPATLGVLANDTDPDGQSLTITSASPSAQHGTVSCTATECTYTPNLNYFGPDSFTYSISDGHGGVDSATVTITVMPGNDPPIAVDDVLTTPQNTPKNIDVLANDIDVDGPEVHVGATQPSHGSVLCTAAGLCTYTPNPGYVGPDSFEYDYSDGAGGADQATVSITVTPAANQPPVAVDDELAAIEDTSFFVSVLLNDSDPDNDPLTVTSASPAAAHGTVSCTSSGGCTYTPSPNYDGTDSFIYTVSDGKGGQDTGQVSITVAPVNDYPVAVDDSLTLTAGTAKSVNVLANDSDIDGDEIAVTTASPAAAHGTVSCTLTGPNAGICTYTPNAGYVGSDSFEYTISDGHGGEDTATVHVTVEAAPPALDAVDDSFTTAEDTAKVMNVFGNDSGAGFMLTGTAQPSHGSVFCTIAGDCTYTPDANYHGPDSFTYTIGNGLASDTATVTMTVTPVNDAPDAVNNSLTTAEDTQGSLNVLGNDTDVDGDTLEVTTLTPTAAHGNVSCTAAGVCTYMPVVNYHGPDSFTYGISDGHGGTDSATVSITVTPVNDAPNAVNDSLTTTAGTARDVNVLANDTDVDGDSLTATTHTTPGHGSVSCTAAGLCTYTPSPGYVGADSFEYTISDGHGGTDTATVNVTVAAALDAVDDSVATAQDTAKVFNVFGNDTGSGFMLTGTTQPAHGGVFCTIAGDCTYTPAVGYHGPDSFTYTIGNGMASDTATVSITVTAAPPANTAPSCADVKPSKTKLWPPRHKFILITLAGATDADGDTLTWSITKVTQDEKTKGAISTTDKGPDAQRVAGKPNQVKLKAERVASGNGRVYRIHYTVSDGKGGTCSGIEKVGVPKSKNGNAIDNVTRRFNSFG